MNELTRLLAYCTCNVYTCIHLGMSESHWTVSINGWTKIVATPSGSHCDDCEHCQGSPVHNYTTYLVDHTSVVRCLGESTWRPHLAANVNTNHMTETWWQMALKTNIFFAMIFGVEQEWTAHVNPFY